MQTGLLGTVTSIVAGEARPVQRTTPEAIDLQRTFREMLDARRRRVRDGDLLARARAAARRGDPLRGGGVHQPQPGPPRLPPGHGELLPGQAAAVRDRSGGADRLRRRRVRPPAGRGVPRDADVRHRRGGRPARARRPVRTPPARTSRCARADGEWSVRLGMPGRFNVLERARRLGGGARARRRAGAAARHLGRRRRAVPGRFEPVDEGQPFAVVVDYSHKPAALENVLQCGARGRRGARDRRVRRGRRPRPRQAPADGGDRARGWPTWRSSPPTTRAPRTRRRSSTEVGGGRARRRASSARSTAARRSRARVELAQAGRHRRDRRQGPRAGAGVRGRAQGAVRRRRRWRARRCRP